MPVRRTQVQLTAAAADSLTSDASWLRDVLRRALDYSLASSLLLAGCAQTHEFTRDMDDAGALDVPATKSLDVPAAPRNQVRAECVLNTWYLAPYFSLASKVDYLADRTQDRTIVSSIGVECDTAKNSAQCQEQVNAASAVTRHLLTTRGDTVQAWDTASANEMFGKTDVPEEAIWWLLAKDYHVACDATIAYVNNRFEIATQREVVTCPGRTPRTTEITVAVDEHGGINELTPSPQIESDCLVVGRRPGGLRSCHRPSTASRLGEHFAAMAHMEAASVPAFAAIARELRHYGAPSALIAAAERARRDEVRHARIAGDLAHRFGTRATRPVVERMPLRTLDAFALDNAVEGCVNETYAAAEATFQAARAIDPLIRRAMQRIAADETRHAALSFEIARWVTPLLARRTRESIAGAQRSAVARLARSVGAERDAELCTRAGLPDANAARALHASLTRELWNA